MLELLLLLLLDGPKIYSFGGAGIAGAIGICKFSCGAFGMFISGLGIDS